MVLSYLTVTRVTRRYIITAAKATFRGFTVKNTKGSTASTEKYLIIKRTSFLFKKKFAVTNSGRRY